MNGLFRSSHPHIPFSVIYDPGSFYGHHEYDLGIAGMFGFSSDFLAAYHEVIPKAERFEIRHKLYQGTISQENNCIENLNCIEMQF